MDNPSGQKLIQNLGRKIRNSPEHDNKNTNPKKPIIMEKLACLLPVLAITMPAVHSATLIADFTNDVGVAARAAAYDPNGLTNLNTTNWTQTSGNAGASHTFRYNISSFNLGTANELLVTVTIPAGDLRSAAGNGIAVNGGANANWWDPTDNVALSFAVSIRDAANADITNNYTVDLTGVGMRWEAGAIARFAGTSATSTADPADFLQGVNLPTGQTAETSFVFDQRSGNNVAQVQQLRFEIVPEPSAALLGLLGAGLLMRRRR